MGVSPAVFWRMSLKEFKLAQRGFFDKMVKQTQLQWEIGRFTAFYAMRPHLKKTAPRTPQKWIPFEWDKKNTKKEIELPTQEEINNEFLKYGKFLDEEGKGTNVKN